MSVAKDIFGKPTPLLGYAAEATKTYKYSLSLVIRTRSRAPRQRSVD